jgi:ligand-binding sensor domain-containing protein/serine phosphatase RsbU (regulator of sigma subunit)
MIRKEIILLFLLALAGQLSSQNYNFHSFSSQEGLAQSYVYSILQDARGYLWVGTGDGLTRYDGFGFKNFTTADSLADNFINCGISDGKCLWLGHMNGRLSYYNGKAFKAVDIPQSTMSPVTCFARGSDGRIWAGTYGDGLVELNGESGVARHFGFKDQIAVVSFAFIDNVEMLVGTASGLFYCRLGESNVVEIIRSVSEIPESKITCIQKMRNGSGFYVATENDGIFQLNTQSKEFRISGIDMGGNEFASIQGILEDSRSDLWVCTFGSGLIKMDLSLQGELLKVSYFNGTGGFASNNVKTLFEDREGNLWSGNYGEGITQITPKTFSIFTFDRPEFGNNIFSMYFDRQYKWIGTGNGLVKMNQQTGEIVRFYNKDSGLPKDTVTSIFSVNDKEIWIGTEKNGLFRMDLLHDRIRKYPIGSGNLENSITCITGKGDHVWIGTKKGLCHLNNASGSISWYTISQGGLPHNVINGLFIDRSGKIWVSTQSNILSYIQDEKVYKIPVSSATGILVLGPVTEDKDSHIWAGSTGNGVFMIGPDSIRNLTMNEGLLSNYCYSIICDSNNNLWVGHKEGLSRIRTRDFSVKPIQNIKDVTDRYQFNPGAAFKDPWERIWLGSDKGMVSYDPSFEYTRFPSPVLGFVSIKINDEEKDIQEKMILPPGDYKIQIGYIGINLKEPSLVKYQYKLEGYDDWSEITSSSSVTYNHLQEGTYTFILYASSGDGAVSENPLIMVIIIKRPFWEKVWFYGLMVLSLILLIFTYIKRREYKFRIERKILEEKVTERTIEIMHQKDEIQLQRDLIDKKNADITSSILYALDIQKAILPPLELINKMFPDSFILYRPKDIVSGDFYWLTERESKIVFAVADCTGHGVPGAFMSLLGITLLNEIVNDHGILRSDSIVEVLRERVIQSLRQSRKDITTSDGLDIALCVLDRHREVIQFTGGMNDLVYIRKGELEVVKADHLSVSAVYEDSAPFTKNEIAYQKGDVFYLFSDGYQDQFGGDKNKKYLAHRFFKTLLEIYTLPMIDQKAILEQNLVDWMKDNIQTDDITVMGIRF